MRRLAVAALVAILLPSIAWAQQTVIQGGPWTPGHAPQYVGQGSQQPVIQDGGGAGGAGPMGGGAGSNVSEIGIVARGTGTPPYIAQGTGPFGSIFCLYDAPITNATGYHSFCLSPNSAGGELMSVAAGGGAAAIPFLFNVNGTTYQFPFTTGGILGPATSVIGHVVTWSNTVGTLAADGGFGFTAGTTGQLGYWISGTNFGGTNIGTGLAIGSGALNVQPAQPAAIGGIESLTCAAHNWLSTISTGGVPACSQPGFSDLSGTLASTQCPAATSAAIGCVLSTINNAVNTQTANYTIAVGDCNNIVQAGTGSSGLFAVTLPSVSGFPTQKCAVTVVNSDTGRGKQLSGFPSDVYCMLYPTQAVTVAIANGAWVTVSNPGRWAPGGNVAFNSDSVNGLNTCASDGLGVGAGAFNTIPYAYSVWSQHMNGTGTAGQKTTVTVQDTTLTITTDIAILGPPAPGYIATGTFLPFQVLGKGASVSTITSSTNGVNIFQGQGGSQFLVDGFTLSTTGTGGACILANDSKIYISNGPFNQVWFGKCANTALDAAGGLSVWSVVGPITWLATGNDNEFAVVESGASGYFTGALTINGTPTITTAGFVADVTARIDLSGFSFTGNFTGSKGNANINGVVFTGGAGCTSGLPGSTAFVTATGGQCQ